MSILTTGAVEKKCRRILMYLKAPQPHPDRKGEHADPEHTGASEKILAGNILPV